MERDEQMKAMQAEIEARAAERDNILNLRGMVPTNRKPEEQKKKKQGKLGPSTIRTLIKAVESRRD